jgi:hypothetical protein
VSEQVHDERNLAGAIYGTILATSVVAGLSEGGSVDKGPAALVVITSSLVFWLAHVYAGVLGHHLRLGHGFSWSRVGAIARHEWPILASGIPPAIVLALGTIGLFERDTAFWLAIGVGIASLVLWGVAYAREQGYHTMVVALAGALNGLLGLVIVALKVLVH